MELIEVRPLRALNNRFHPLLRDLRFPVIRIQPVLLLLDVGATQCQHITIKKHRHTTNSQLRPHESTDYPGLHCRHDDVLNPLQEVFRVFGSCVTPVSLLFFVFAHSDVDAAELCAQYWGASGM